MPQNANIACFFEEQVRMHGDAPALRLPCGRTHGGDIRYRQFSYAELATMVDAAARLLKKKGVAKGTRVLVMVRPGASLIALVYALFWLGAVPVVIDPGMGVKPFLKCVRRTGPDVLAGVPLACLLSLCFRKAFAKLKARLWITRRFAQKPSAEPPVPMQECAPQDLAAILFTSGSTGAPKGVCYTHEIFAEQVKLLREVFGFLPGERDFPMLPVFSLFNPSLGSLTIVPEMNPSRPAKADPEKLVRALIQNRATMSFGSPVLWAKVCAYCLDRHMVLPDLQRVLSAGAPVPPRILRQLAKVAPNARVQTPYGATEALPVAVIEGSEILAHTWARTEAGEGTCVGTLVGDAQVRILPIIDGPIAQMADVAALPQGQKGEIAVRGAVVTQRYDALEEATRRAKIPDSTGGFWHRMGDVGYIDEEGCLWFCGRVAERVTTPQETFFTDNCEAVFNRDPEVFRTALLGLGAPGRQIPALAVEPLPHAWPKTRAQKKAFARRLADLGKNYPHTKMIKSFFFIKKFPVDVRHNAKIHRLSLARACAKSRSKGVSAE